MFLFMQEYLKDVKRPCEVIIVQCHIDSTRGQRGGGGGEGEREREREKGERENEIKRKRGGRGREGEQGRIQNLK